MGLPERLVPSSPVERFGPRWPKGSRPSGRANSELASQVGGRRRATRSKTRSRRSLSDSALSKSMTRMGFGSAGRKPGLARAALAGPGRAPQRPRDARPFSNLLRAVEVSWNFLEFHRRKIKCWDFKGGFKRRVLKFRGILKAGFWLEFKVPGLFVASRMAGLRSPAPAPRSKIASAPQRPRAGARRPWLAAGPAENSRPRGCKITRFRILRVRTSRPQAARPPSEGGGGGGAARDFFGRPKASVRAAWPVHARPASY